MCKGGVDSGAGGVEREVVEVGVGGDLIKRCGDSSQRGGEGGGKGGGIGNVRGKVRVKGEEREGVDERCEVGEEGGDAGGVE